MLVDSPVNSTLTSAQRFHFDAYGYVVLPKILEPELVADMIAALRRAASEPDRAARALYVNADEPPHLLHLGNVVQYADPLTRYATHPRLIPLVEEVVGGTVRLEESEAIINRRNRADDAIALRNSANGVHATAFHTGTRAGWGTWTERERFHCLFVKTLAYLTDVGPGDGGTAVIPGSHKMTWPEAEMIEAARADAGALVRQICAPAGSVILFAESLIHSTTKIWTDTERIICVSGYVPPMLREWPGNELSPEFLARQADTDARRILSGSESWHWRRRGA